MIAISLLVSPIWMISVRRFLRVAEDGISDFRSALAEVYAGEIEEFERGRAAIGRLVVFIARQATALWIVVKRRRAGGSRTPPVPVTMSADPPPAEDDEEKPAAGQP